MVKEAILIQSRYQAGRYQYTDNMDQSAKDFHQIQSSKYTPSLVRRGIISKVNIPGWVADVILIGGTQTVMKSVSLSSSIPVTVAPGDKCLVSTQTENVSGDCVVLCTYGKKPNNIRGGTASVTFSLGGNDTSQVIAHGLNGIPTIYTVAAEVYGKQYASPASTVITLGLYISSVDVNSLHLSYFSNASAGGNVTLAVNWIAGIV